MKKKFSNIIFVLIFLSGLSLMLYPYVSNQWNTYRQSKLITTYEEMVTEELYHIFPIGAPVVMMVLSLLFCALQAMVFTMLVSIYLEEVTED